MFNHKHYVPILKGKRAEFPALGSLHSKDRITPLMEAVPSKSATQIPQGMAAQWPQDNASGGQRQAVAAKNIYARIRGSSFGWKQSRVPVAEFS